MNKIFDSFQPQLESIKVENFPVLGNYKVEFTGKPIIIKEKNVNKRISVGILFRLISLLPDVTTDFLNIIGGEFFLQIEFKTVNVLYRYSTSVVLKDDQYVFQLQDLKQFNNNDWIEVFYTTEYKDYCILMNSNRNTKAILFSNLLYLDSREIIPGIEKVLEFGAHDYLLNSPHYVLIREFTELMRESKGEYENFFIKMCSFFLVNIKKIEVRNDDMLFDILDIRDRRTAFILHKKRNTILFIIYLVTSLMKGMCLIFFENKETEFYNSRFEETLLKLLNIDALNRLRTQILIIN